jgi:hypothetical protein
MAFAYLCGAAGMILNGRSSDHHGEARYHCGLAALTSAVSMAVFGFLVPDSPYLSLMALTLAIVGTMSAIPVFWQNAKPIFVRIRSRGGNSPDQLRCKPRRIWRTLCDGLGQGYDGADVARAVAGGRFRGGHRTPDYQVHSGSAS